LAPVIADHFSWRAALRAGRVSIIEGRVESFRPLASPRDRLESFSVGSKTFKYSKYEMTTSFKKTAIDGGPIRDGLLVRVSYLDRHILQLEVANESGRG